MVSQVYFFMQTNLRLSKKHIELQLSDQDTLFKSHYFDVIFCLQPEIRERKTASALPFDGNKCEVDLSFLQLRMMISFPLPPPLKG